MMKWIIEDGIFPENQEKIIESCKRNGIGYSIVKPDYSIDSFCAERDSIFYGSINGALLVKRNSNAQVWIDGFECSRYMPLVDSNLLLNYEYFFVPYGEMIRAKDQIFNWFGTSSLFIRPNSGLKQFTGFVVTKQDWEKEIRLINMFPDELVLVASPRLLCGSEYRLLVCDGEIITGSCYMDNSRNKVIEDHTDEVPEDVIEVGEKIAKSLNETWYGNYPAYTMDLAKPSIFGPVELVEINSFSCAGLYGMDIEKVVTSITKCTKERIP